MSKTNRSGTKIPVSPKDSARDDCFSPDRMKTPGRKALLAKAKARARRVAYVDRGIHP